ncbi:MAG: hypothetical protein V4819_12690 [Verrucomicrobiota bacterium]
MKTHNALYFEYSNSYSPVTVATDIILEPKCEKCNQSKFRIQYQDVIITVNDIKSWPLFFSGFQHNFLHEKVVEIFQQEKISGCAFRGLARLDGTWLSELSDPPNYFVWEPTGKVGLHAPMDECTQCDYCGRLDWTVFGSKSKPLLLDWSDWDGSDVVTISHLPGMICVNKKVVNLFRKHGWHHQPIPGRGSQNYEAMGLGSYKVPGIGIRNIDSDTWYDDTVAACR